MARAGDGYAEGATAVLEEHAPPCPGTSPPLLRNRPPLLRHRPPFSQGATAMLDRTNPPLCPRCNGGLHREDNDVACIMCGYRDWEVFPRHRKAKPSLPPYTLAEVATLTGTSVTTLRQWCDMGLIANATKQSVERYQGDPKGTLNEISGIFHGVVGVCLIRTLGCF